MGTNLWYEDKQEKYKSQESRNQVENQEYDQYHHSQEYEDLRCSQIYPLWISRTYFKGNIKEKNYVDKCF